MKLRLIAIVSLALACWIVGFVMGGGLSTAPPSTAPTAAIPTPTPSATPPADFSTESSENKIDRLASVFATALHEGRDRESSGHATRAIVLSVEKLNESDFPAAFTALKKLPPESSYQFHPYLILRWANLNLAGMIEYTIAPERGATPDADQLRKTAVAEWIRRDATAAGAYLDAHPDRARLVGEDFISSHLAQADPFAALARLKANPPSPWSADVTRFSQIIARIAKKDVSAAVAEIAAIKDPMYQSIAAGGIAEALRFEDPERALAIASQITHPDVRHRTYEEVLLHWLYRDPEAAIAKYKTLPPTPRRQQILTSAAGTLLYKDIAQAVRLLGELPPDARESAALSVAKDASQAAAIEALLPLVQSEAHRDKLLGLQATRMLASTPREALALLEQKIPDPSRRNPIIESLVNTWALSQPAEAAQWLMQNQSESNHRRLRSVFETWIYRDPQRAIAFVEALPEGNPRTQATMGLAARVGESDYARVEALIESLPHSVQAEGRTELLRHSMQRNPFVAAQKMLTLPDNDDRASLLSSAIGFLSQSDSEEAEDLLAKIPTGKSREASLAAFSRAIAERYPQRAISYAESMEGNFKREETLREIYRGWRYADATAAQKWLRSTAALTPEQKAAFTAQP